MDMVVLPLCRASRRSLLRGSDSPNQYGYLLLLHARYQGTSGLERQIRY